jgi:hypothetical protein
MSYSTRDPAISPFRRSRFHGRPLVGIALLVIGLSALADTESDFQQLEEYYIANRQIKEALALAEELAAKEPGDTRFASVRDMLKKELDTAVARGAPDVQVSGKWEGVLNSNAVVETSEGAGSPDSVANTVDSVRRGVLTISDIDDSMEIDWTEVKQVVKTTSKALGSIGDEETKNLPPEHIPFFQFQSKDGEIRWTGADGHDYSLKTNPYKDGCVTLTETYQKVEDGICHHVTTISGSGDFYNADRVKEAANHKEYIILTGGISFKEWQSHRDDPEDAAWKSFINASRTRFAQLRQQYGPDALITWLVYKQEMPDLVSLVNDVRGEFHLNLVFFNTAQDVIDYLNYGRPRDVIKVADFEYFGDSNRTSFIFDEDAEVAGAAKCDLDEKDLVKISPGIFSKYAFNKSWGSHSGEEFTGYWKSATGTQMWGAIGETDYSDSAQVKLAAPGGRWVDYSDSVQVKLVSPGGNSLTEAPPPPPDSEPVRDDHGPTATPTNGEKAAIIDAADHYANIRDGGSSDARIVGRVNENDQFFVTPNSDAWWPARTKDGTTGYMRSKFIKILDSADQDATPNPTLSTNGDGDSLFAQGVAFRNGNGEAQDYAQALSCFQQAASLGHAGAQNMIGVMYARGEGVDKNRDRAAEWYQKSADQGFAEGQYDLGVCYMLGLGVDQNESIGIDLYKKAAAQGYADAECELGSHLINGDGAPKDENAGIELCRKAAAQGSVEATQILNNLNLPINP